MDFFSTAAQHAAESFALNSQNVVPYLQDVARVQHGNLAHKFGHQLVDDALLLVVPVLFQLFAQHLR